jgi:hypothetical protein
VSDSIETTAVVVRDNNNAVGEALGVDQILAQVTLIQNVMHKVMHEGEHYGKVPGCGDKKTLLQPGAQKLTMTFRLAPAYEIQESVLPRGHKEYRVICTLKSIQSGNFVGQGVGCCSSMEAKYRYRGGARKCPSCGKETIIKGKAEYGGGWICFAKKGGCGAKWPDGATEIESQSIERVEHDNPADFFNTVLKMAKKRAFVDATITATAASDIFTQDIGDDEAETNNTGESNPPPTTAQNARQTAPAASKAPEPTKTKAKTTEAPQMPTEATRKWALGEIEKAGLMEFLPEWLEAAGMIMPGENLEDWPLMWVPASKAQMETVIAKVKAFSQGLPAEKPFTAHGAEKFKAIEVPRDEQPDPNSPSAHWRSCQMPFGKEKGRALADLDKKYLYGLWANFEVQETWEDDRGNVHDTKPEKLAQDQRLREMLDEAGKHYEFTKD